MKILIVKGDKLQTMISDIKDRFVFILTDQGEVYHFDSADGIIWLSSFKDLEGLGAGHRRLIKKITKGE